MRRSRKGESAFKVFTAGFFYRIIKRLTKVSIPVDTGDFRLMSRRVVEALRRSPERHRFLRGMVSWVGFNQVGVVYDRDVRLSGQTKYPLPKMIRFAIDAITSFSDIPLRFAAYFGFAVSAIAFVYALVVVIDKLFGVYPPAYTPGWASTIVAVVFLGGVQLISLGIIGEYFGPNLRRSKRAAALFDQRRRALLTLSARRRPLPHTDSLSTRGRPPSSSPRSSRRRCLRHAGRHTGLCGLIVATPFAFYREVAGTSVTLPKVVLAGVLIGLATYPGVGRGLRERPMPLLLGALAFYVAITALTIVAAAHPGATVRETFKFAEYAALLVAAYSATVSIPTIRSSPAPWRPPPSP